MTTRISFIVPNDWRVHPEGSLEAPESPVEPKSLEGLGKTIDIGKLLQNVYLILTIVIKIIDEKNKQCQDRLLATATNQMDRAKCLLGEVISDIHNS